MNENDVIVYMHHVRKSGMCSGGAREFFIKHGLSWDEFLKNGISVEKLKLTNDAMAFQVCECAIIEYKKTNGAL